MKSNVFLRVGIAVFSMVSVLLLAGCGGGGGDANEAALYSVSGTVLDGRNETVDGVSISVAGDAINDHSVDVAPDGKWSAPGLKGEVTLTPIKEGWNFTPASLSVVDEDSGRTDIGFVAENLPVAATLVPEDASTDVAPDTVVSVEFNQLVTVGDLSAIAIADSGANPTADVAAALSGNTLTITHGDLAFGTGYTVSVPVAAVESGSGDGNEAFSWSFTTQAAMTAPAAVDLTPADGSDQVEPDTVVATQFDKEITAVNPGAISIRTASGGVPVNGIDIAISGRTITVGHNVFQFDTSYEVLIPEGTVANADGIGNGPLSWTYTTRQAVAAPGVVYRTPAEGSDGVKPDAVVAIEYDKDIAAVNLSGISIKVSGSGIPAGGVGGVISGRTITINHDDLAFDTLYDVTIPEGTVANADGIVNSQVIWTFSICPSYILETQWGGWGSGEGELYYPRGIAIDSFDNVYVADTNNHRIQKFSSSGTYLAQWPCTYVRYLAVDGFDAVYALRGSSSYIHKYTSSGIYLTEWGTYGSAAGQFDYPNGIAADKLVNAIYVNDTSNERIQKFNPEGVYQLDWGSLGDGTGQFHQSYGIAVDGDGNVFVTDSGNDRIQKFNSSGVFLTQWGSTGDGAGQFDLPYGIAVDSAGDVYVADTYNDRIQKFGSNGLYLTQWGSTGDGAGQFDRPNGIAVDSAGCVYVADSNNDRIQKFVPSE